jgi:RecJ-like exonuclease
LKYVAPFIINYYIAIKKVMKKIICTACDGTGSVKTHTKVIVCPQCEGVGLDKPLPKPKFKSKLKKE